MKILIDGIETPCHSSVKIIYDSLKGGELHIAHTHEGMITDVIVGGTVMATESFMAQANLDTLLEGE